MPPDPLPHGVTTSKRDALVLAENFREKAAQTQDAYLADAYNQLADGYEALARGFERAERLG